MATFEHQTETAGGLSALTEVLCNAIRNTKVVCNRCGSELPERPRWSGYYSCKTCNSWTVNVRYRSANPLAYRGA